MTNSTKSLLALVFIASSISIIGSQDLYAGRNWHGENQQAAFAQSPKKTSISITSPQHGSRIQCLAKKNNQCFFKVQGKASNLGKDKYISLMLQVPGGNQWWHSGNSIRSTSSTWNISMISVDLGQSFDQVEAKVIVTTSSLPSGQTYQSLPAHEGESSTYLWLLPE
jgi:hypothetical protein